ncbi:MAG TPA: Gfo/Idh/MocA family oxidoreductase [Vicinamibacterales bacterium]|jgi:predicted dehydrogenase
MSHHHGQTRRAFLGSVTGAATVALAAVNVRGLSRRPEADAATGRSARAANDRIQIALIGAGGMGVEDAKTALTIDGVRLVAACDLYDGRLQKAQEMWGRDILTTRDYREVLARKNVDAVIIGTPDHWHQRISIDAMDAGKAVYCEKPMVHELGEGDAVIAAQRRNKAVFEVGSQGMSSLGNEKARELLAAGAIGTLNYAEGFWARNSPVGAWQYPVPKDASAQTLDFDRFLGSSPKRPFDPIRFFRWRNYRDYGTGVSGDLFVHLFSSLHFITGSMGPTTIMASGGLRYWKDGRDAPDIMLGMFEYPEAAAHPPFNLSLRVNFVDGTSGSTYLRLVGSEGAMDVTWDDVTLRRNKKWDPLRAIQAEFRDDPEPASRQQMLPSAVVYKVETGYKGAHYDHFNNLFTAMRGGKPVAEDAVFGYRAAAPALACNQSYYEKRVIHWDPVGMKVVG